QINPMRLDKRHTLIEQQPLHDIGMPPHPSSGQITIAIYDAMARQVVVGWKGVHDPTDPASVSRRANSLSDISIGRHVATRDLGDSASDQLSKSWCRERSGPTYT